MLVFLMEQTSQKIVESGQNQNLNRNFKEYKHYGLNQYVMIQK